MPSEFRYEHGPRAGNRRCFRSRSEPEGGRYIILNFKSVHHASSQGKFQSKYASLRWRQLARLPGVMCAFG